MNRFLLVIPVLAISSGSLAADLAQPRRLPITVPPTWSGPYIGLHAGFGWGREKDNQAEIIPGQGGGGDNDAFNVRGFVAGAHAGYSRQFNRFVLGFEGDIDYTRLSGESSAYYHGWLYRHLALDVDWQSSLRLRAGYAMDHLLVYGTGGFAVAGAGVSVNGVDAGRRTHMGWTVGGGAEYLFGTHWVGRVELRYSAFQDAIYQTIDGPMKARWDQTTVTTGISYKY